LKPVRIVAKNPDIDITIPMGDGPARLVGGLGGWTPIPVLDDIEAVDWEGQAPLAQDVPLLLNGLEDNESVEREWNTVRKLARDPNGDETKPPVFKVWGPVEYPGKAWVLPDGGIDINEEEIFKRDGDGELLRIEFTLHLLEYRSPEEIKERSKRRKKKGPRAAIAPNIAVGGTYTTQAWDTLKKIAAKLYRDPDRWKEIGEKNNIHDPNRVLPAGKVLQL
jgi:hypothetical protein